MLSDPEKRKLYDVHGEEGLQGGGAGGPGAGGPFGGGGAGGGAHFQGGDPFRMFEMFFGQGGGGFGGGGFPGGFGGGNVHFGGGGGPGGGFGGHQQQQQGHHQRRQQRQQQQGGSLYAGDKNVVELTSSTMPKDDRWLWILEFYAPWCARASASRRAH